MHKEVLYEKQLEILRILKIFWKDFYLAWWTAIALQLWHRKSIDFDFFSNKKINNSKIIKKLQENNFLIDYILVDNKTEELTLIVNWVKITFLYYPFEIVCSEKFEWIKLPNLEYLWAMKFYTIWRRAKWKDYVDVYKILKEKNNFVEISKLAEKIFWWAYNEKLFREQICYYDDIDYSEEVEFLGEKIEKNEIENFLKKISVS